MLSVTVGVGLVCALLSALGTNIAFLLKHRGACDAPEVDMHHPLRSGAALFRSKWWTIGWLVAGIGFALHSAALSMAPISVGQAVLAGGLVFLAVLAERFFGMEIGRRQWIGISLVAVSLVLLTVTGGGGGKTRSTYSLSGMICFEGIALCACAALVTCHAKERLKAPSGVLLGIAAGLGFAMSDVAVKAFSGDLGSVTIVVVAAWLTLIAGAAIFSFFASARSLQVGDGVAVIAVTSVAANLSAIIAGLAVFGDHLGRGALVVGVRVLAFVLILAGAALIPAPVRAADAAAEGEPERSRRPSPQVSTA